MARFRARLTPSQLARMVGTDEAEIKSWETGSSVIYFDEMAVVCRGAGHHAARRAGLAAGLTEPIRVSITAAVGCTFGVLRPLPVRRDPKRYSAVSVASMATHWRPRSGW